MSPKPHENPIFPYNDKDFQIEGSHTKFGKYNLIRKSIYKIHKEYFIQIIKKTMDILFVLQLIYWKYAIMILIGKFDVPDEKYMFSRDNYGSYCGFSAH